MMGFLRVRQGGRRRGQDSGRESSRTSISRGEPLPRISNPSSSNLISSNLSRNSLSSLSSLSSSSTELGTGMHLHSSYKVERCRRTVLVLMNKM